VKVCTSFFTTVVNNTALNSSDNLPSYLPDNHHMSDAREEMQLTEPSPIQQAAHDSVFHQM